MPAHSRSGWHACPCAPCRSGAWQPHAVVLQRTLVDAVIAKLCGAVGQKSMCVTGPICVQFGEAAAEWGGGVLCPTAQALPTAVHGTSSLLVAHLLCQDWGLEAPPIAALCRLSQRAWGILPNLQPRVLRRLVLHRASELLLTALPGELRLRLGAQGQAIIGLIGDCFLPPRSPVYLKRQGRGRAMTRSKSKQRWHAVQ